MPRVPAVLLALVAGSLSSVRSADAVAAPRPADAPAEERAPAALEEHVSVTAKASIAEDVAAFCTRLDMAEVSRRGEDLADILRLVPGARVRDYGGLGSFATVSLRGSTADQVAVLVDGVPQNRALGGPVDLSSVPATQVETVTVFRGFAPAGSSVGGIGGLIDVRTRAPGTNPEFAIDLLAGQLDTQRLSGGASMRAAGGRLRVGFEALHSEGDFLFYDDRGTPHNSADDGTSRRVNNDVEQASLLVRQIWEHAAGGFLGLGLRVEARDRGLPGKGNVQSTTARLEDDLVDLAGTWRRGLEGPLDGVELGFDTFAQETDSSSGTDPASLPFDRTTRLSGGGLTALARSSPGRNGLLFRGEARHEIARVGVASSAFGQEGEATRRTLALTVEDVVVLGRFTLAPSARLERLHNQSFDSGSDLADAAWSGKLGIAWRVTQDVGVRGSVGRYQRSPSLYELFGDSGEVTGNPRLEPERGDAAELGVEWRGSPPEDGWRVELVGFAREVDGLIWLIPVSQGVSKPQNVSRAAIEGLEASFGIDGPANIRFDAAGTWQHSKDVSDGFTAGYPLVYQPELAGWMGLAWTRGQFDARWQVAYTGENSTTRLDDPAFRVPERVLHDVYGSWSWNNGLRAGVDIRNVFDRAVLDVFGYPLPDRTLYAHLGWQSGAR